MKTLEKLNVGLVGAAGRGGSFRSALEANGARIHAICDVRPEALDECMANMGASEKYANYEEMLERSELDAVVLGTPMPLHVPQSIAALDRNLHVLCEVPAGVSVEECQNLVQAAGRSKAIYIMAENYTYMKPNVLIRELVRQGLFGEVYYAEGEYLHELKELNEITRWRREWQTGIAGITYGTHSLGPILQWMPGDRVTRVMCENSGSHYKDPRGKPYAQDHAVMLCKTARGALIKIRLDMISDRPHAMTNYQLQGTDGAYESSRGGPVDQGKIWLRKLSREMVWHDLDSLMAIDELAEKFLPEDWHRPPEEALRAGHGGGDYFEVRDFIRAIRGEASCPVGIHEAMDMTLPGLYSQESITKAGEWITVPDSRTWIETPPRPQLRMRFPREKLEHLISPELSNGYELGLFRDEDSADYCALMTRIGFGVWDEARLKKTLQTILPHGFFVVRDRRSGRVVASAMAMHRAIENYPYGGELGWVVTDAEHQGRGLGKVVCAAVLHRFNQAGYENIFLFTDDFRLPALNVYLQLGFAPDIDSPEMEERWRIIREQIAERNG